MSIQSKRMAFIKSIREIQLKSYFAFRREQLQQCAAQEQMILSRVQSLFAKLPQQIGSLVKELEKHFTVVSYFLIQQVEEFCRRMLSTPNVEWCNFVYVINRLLVSTNDKHHIKKIVDGSWLAVLEGAEKQLQKTDNNKMQKKILKLVIKYCNRLGGFFKVMPQLQHNALINAMKRLWDFMWQQEKEEIALVQTSLKLFTTNFDEEDQKNITKMQRLEADNSKVKLIRQIFYEAPNEHRLQHIIQKMMVLLPTPSEQKSQLLNLYLRLLITFTKYPNKMLYVQPLLKYNVLHIISTIIQAQSYQEQSIIFSLRLFNNLLMNDEVELTAKILKELSLSKVINQYHNTQQIGMEIVELLNNLTHLLDENQQYEIIRELIPIESTEIVIKSLELYSNLKDNTLLQEGVVTLHILFSIHRTQVEKIVREHSQKLTEIVNLNWFESDLLICILCDCGLLDQDSPQ